MSERRKHYRKRLNSVGYIVDENDTCQFQLEDLSLDGLGARFDVMPKLEPGDVVRIRLPELGLEGLVTVIRLVPILGNCFNVGFCFNSSMLYPVNA